MIPLQLMVKHFVVYSLLSKEEKFDANQIKDAPRSQLIIGVQSIMGMKATKPTCEFVLKSCCDCNRIILV